MKRKPVGFRFGTQGIGSAGSGKMRRLYLRRSRPIRNVLTRSYFVEQSRLPEKESFDLKQIIAMFVDRAERKRSRPTFERVSVQSETEITGKSNEESVFPIPVASLQPFFYLQGFLLQPFRLQRSQPRVYGNLW